MKVLHVLASVAEVRGGPSRAILDMVKALRECGIDAEILTTNDNGLNLLKVPLGKQVNYEEVPVYFFPRFSPVIASLREFAFSSQLTAWLWQHITDYDLVHIHAIFSYPSTIAMIIARSKGVPYITLPHGLLCQWSLEQSSRKKNIYLNLIERANLNHSQALHFTAEQEQQEVSKLGLNVPNFVLPLGLNIPSPIPDAHERLRQHLNLPPDEPVILFMSRLHPKKGLDYFIPALAQLTNYRFSFVIAGSGAKEYEAEIESLLVSTGIRDRTHLVGFVTGEQKDLLLQGSNLFVLTSHSENFGVVVLESLAAGVPVLLTPGVSLAFFVQEYHLGYITELNISMIASTLKTFFNEPQKAKEMGHLSRQLVLEKYSWNHIAENLIKIYQKTIN